jgi:hypothetical protein
MSNDYIPNGDDACLDWMLNFYNEVKENYTAWGTPDPTEYRGVLGGVEKRFHIAEAPLTGEDLPFSEFTRKRTYRADFSEADRGKTVYFCLMYENGKGNSGPWGPILQAIIP